MSKKKIYCKYCNKEIEWRIYQRQDGSEGFRPVDPGSDSHECISTTKMIDVVNRLDQVLKDLKGMLYTK